MRYRSRLCSWPLDINAALGNTAVTFFYPKDKLNDQMFNLFTRWDLPLTARHQISHLSQHFRGTNSNSTVASQCVWRWISFWHWYVLTSPWHWKYQELSCSVAGLYTWVCYGRHSTSSFLSFVKSLILHLWEHLIASVTPWTASWSRCCFSRQTSSLTHTW